MLRKSEKIFMSSNSKQKSLCQLADTEFYPKETNNKVTERKRQKCIWSNAGVGKLRPARPFHAARRHLQKLLRM